MFTGLVEAVGTVEGVRELDDARRIRIRTPEIAGELSVGDSLAVDGACLTAVGVEGGVFEVEAIATTLSRTIAGGYRAGSRVNLERGLRLSDRLDGHFVQGHVDGVGELAAVRREGQHRLLDFRIPPEIAAVTILHGSIALNGVSLTVNALDRGECQVAIIPHTWERTNLRDLTAGDSVNVEGDLIGKYVGRMAAAWASRTHAPPPLS